jgi:hypothetical protein
MNDYQMSKLAHDHTSSLRVEAQRSRLAREAEGGSGRSWLRRVVGAAFAWVPDRGAWGNDEWAPSPHRGDAWGSDRTSH